MKDIYSAAVLKQGIVFKSGSDLKRAVKHLNHQAKRRDRRERPEGKDWKK